MGNLNVNAKLSRRGQSIIAEIAIAPGPVSMEIGSGTYEDLFGYVWAAVIEKSGELNLYQDSSGVWVKAYTFTDTPIAPDRMRHLSLAFDQAGRPIIAFEHEGFDQVYVRQWDAIASAYTYRGPFNGVDPVLIMDATVNKDIPNSDIILFHLTPNRKELKYRVQRDQYATEYHSTTFNGTAYLDQAVSMPIYIELAGETRIGQGSTYWYIESEKYPYIAEDILDQAVFSAPGGGEYRSVIVVIDLSQPPYGIDSLDQAVFSAPDGGAYTSVVVTIDLSQPPYGIDSLNTAVFTQPDGGNYYLVVVVVDLSQPPYGIDDLGTGVFSQPGGGDYKLVVVVIDLSQPPYGIDDLGTGTFTQPSGGSYDPA